MREIPDAPWPMPPSGGSSAGHVDRRRNVCPLAAARREDTPFANPARRSQVLAVRSGDGAIVIRLRRAGGSQDEVALDPQAAAGMASRVLDIVPRAGLSPAGQALAAAIVAGIGFAAGIFATLVLA